jgi:glycosyltransferase involved in cell wall biosynthesis
MLIGGHVIMRPRITLCITTYNNSLDVVRVLESVKAQEDLVFEVLICDDGSSPIHVNRIQGYLSANFSIPFDYVWHPDLGWRLSAIRNLGISRATGDFIIFVDGDCILHPLFVCDYLDCLKKREFVIGQRVHIKKDYRAIRFSGSRSDRLRFLIQHRFCKSRFAFRNPFEQGATISNLKHLTSPLPVSGIGLGCNHGFWKSDAMAIAGFDETFSSWGPEDSDFAFRMINSGVSLRILKRRCLVYHLDHGNTSAFAAPEPLRNGYRLMLESFQGKRVVSAVSSLSTC